MKYVSKKIKMKTVARLAAVQATYMIDYTSNPVDEVIKDFVDGRVGRFAIEEDLGRNVEEILEISELDTNYFTDIVTGVHKNKEELEASFNKYLTGDLSYDKFDGTLRALFLCAVYEIAHTTDIDSRVLIQEYVDLAYAFFSKNEPKMVNAILDTIAKDIR